MKIGVLGTGVVGQTLGTRLVELGHDVVMGSRDAANPKAAAWLDAVGGRTAGRARTGTFADAAAHGEIVVNATSGAGSLAALDAAGAGNLSGKVLVDVANPLDYSHGMPPMLLVANTDSLAERIQRGHPSARVVKALNTVTADVMVHPEIVPGDHDLFLAGDDPAAKEAVAALLTGFGWKRGSIHDLGGIGAARGLEMYLPLWVHLMAEQGTAHFNVKVVRG